MPNIRTHFIPDSGTFVAPSVSGKFWREKKYGRFLACQPGKPYCRGRIITVDLLTKTGCFVKKEKYSFSMKSS
jgi:hypothetical protein